MQKDNRDKFTISTSTGNGKLTYPVGLITVDEIVTAGGVAYGDNESYYLYKGPWYWSMSPSYTINGTTFIFGVYVNGRFNSNHLDSTNFGSVVPVINLKKEYTNSLVGDGSIINPYREFGVTP